MIDAPKNISLLVSLIATVHQTCCTRHNLLLYVVYRLNTSSSRLTQWPGLLLATNAVCHRSPIGAVLRKGDAAVCRGAPPGACYRGAFERRAGTAGEAPGKAGGRKDRQGTAGGERDCLTTNIRLSYDMIQARTIIGFDTIPMCMRPADTKIYVSHLKTVLMHGVLQYIPDAVLSISLRSSRGRSGYRGRLYLGTGVFVLRNNKKQVDLVKNRYRLRPRKIRWPKTACLQRLSGDF